jgi:hypothetical protein
MSPLHRYPGNQAELDEEFLASAQLEPMALSCNCLKQCDIIHVKSRTYNQPIKSWLSNAEVQYIAQTESYDAI